MAQYSHLPQKYAIDQLCRITQSGYRSRVLYDGQKRHPASQPRVIEPLKLLQRGPSLLTIQSMQFYPEVGVKSFHCERFISIEKDNDPIPLGRLRNNSFAAGEIITVSASIELTRSESSESTGAESNNERAWNCRWFIDFKREVLLALTDCKISDSELIDIRLARDELRITPAQADSVYASIFGEELTAAGMTGELDEHTAVRVKQIYTELKRLGWQLSLGEQLSTE